MDQLIKIARGMGIEDAEFFQYLSMRSLEEKEKYSAHDVFVTLLGRTHRTYQYWERDADFPVPDPVRESIRGAMGRMYTPDQVAEIAWWWWRNRAIERRGRRRERRSVYATPTNTLGLSVRAYLSLKRAGITTVGQVLEKLADGGDELLAIRNFGVKSLAELKVRVEEILREGGGVGAGEIGA